MPSRLPAFLWNLIAALLAACAHAPVSRPDASIEQWIDDAFDRLPIVLTHRGGERIRVVWHDERRPFGTGRSEAEIADLEANAIHLYQPELGSKRAVQRAVAYSLIWALDLEEEWSSTPEWMAQNGWRAALSSLFSLTEHALNIDPRGYADARGRTSARADLASFAAHYFFPEPEDDVRCRLLSQARFLGDRLELPQRECAGFERWARLQQIESVEVGMASPTTRAAGSLFGHLLLRVLYDSGESRVIAFLAEVQGELEDDPFYAVKGLFGGYRARLMERSFEDVYRDYVVIEGRDLSRWQLNLQKEETRILLERIWTLERSGAFNYYFLRQNCASLLVELFNSVLPVHRRIDHAGAIGQGPGAALDGLSFAKASDGSPLVTYVPEPMRSFAREAREADQRRTEMAEELAYGSPEAAAAFAGVASPDSQVRADAYRRLASLGLEKEKVDRYLSDSLEVESHLSSAKNTEAEEAKVKEQRRAGSEMMSALREGLPHDLAFATSDPHLAVLLEQALELLGSLDPLERRLGYQTMLALIQACESHRAIAERERQRRLRMVEDGARLFAVLNAIHFFDPRPRSELFFPARGKSLGEQAYVGEMRPLVEYDYVTEVSKPLLAIARSRKEVGAPRSPEREDARAKEQLRYQAAYPHTGMDVLSVRGSNRGLVIAGALYDEQLGDRRRHGFSSDTALMIGQSDVVWGWRDGRPSVMESQTRLIGYRSLRPAFDVEGPFLSRLGFEIAMGLETMRDEGRWIRGEVQGGVLVPLYASDDLSDHLLVKAGASVLGWLIQDATDAGGLGIPVGLELRAELGPVIANLDILATPVIDPWIGEVHLTAASTCRVRIPIYDRLVLPWRGHVGIFLEGGARVSYSEIPSADGIFVRVDAGVRIE